MTAAKSSSRVTTDAASAGRPASSSARVRAAASAYASGLVVDSGPAASGSSSWTGARAAGGPPPPCVGQQGGQPPAEALAGRGLPRLAQPRGRSPGLGEPGRVAGMQGDPAQDVQRDVVDVAVASVADLVGHLDRRLGLGPGVREPAGAEQGAEPEHGPDADVGRYPVPLGGLHPGVDQRERLVQAAEGDGDQRLPRVRQPQPDRLPPARCAAGRPTPPRGRGPAASPRRRAPARPAGSA